MFVNERFDKILDYLKKYKKASIQDLAKLFYISESTVRRDIDEMQSLGLIARYHGGALYLERADEVSIYVRMEKNAKEKELAASIALQHLPNFKTIFIDNSSTCLALAQRMDLTNKTVITNGLQVAMKLSNKKDIDIIVPGGNIKFNTNSITGSLTIHQLSSFNFDLMICSCASLDQDGAFELSLETTQIKKVALEHSKQKILIVDDQKFTSKATYQIASLNEFDYVITNASDDVVKPLRNNSIVVYNELK